MYAISASNHGLGSVPCDLSATLFGRFSGVDDRELSREFATRAEAEAALAELEASGDWPDGAPDYEIVETEAVANG